MTKPPFWPRRRKRKKNCPAAAPAPRRGPFTGGIPLRHQDAPAVPAAPVPVQIKLAPVNAPWFDGAKLLVAADCTAYAYAAFHERFIRGHITLVGCPKLDDVDYSEKLTASSAATTFKRSLLCAWRCPAAAGWKMPPSAPCSVRQVHSVAGRNDLHRRADSGLIFLQKGLAFRKAVCYNNIRR